MHEALHNCSKTQDSPSDRKTLAIHSILRREVDLISICGPNFKMMFSSDNKVHFIDEEFFLNYVDFDCGFTSYAGGPTKIGWINRERKKLSRSREKPQCIPNNNQRNSSEEEAHTSNIFVYPFSSWNMDPAALMTLNHTTDRDCMSNQYPQRKDNSPFNKSLITDVLFIATDGQ